MLQYELSDSLTSKETLNIEWLRTQANLPVELYQWINTLETLPIASTNLNPVGFRFRF